MRDRVVKLNSVVAESRANHRCQRRRRKDYFDRHGNRLQRTTTSNSAGLYQFLDMPPGDYRMESTATGFASLVVSNITMVVKTPSTVNIRFQIASVATSVTVESLAPLINRTDASLGNTVQQDQLSELPIADRNVV